MSVSRQAAVNKCQKLGQPGTPSRPILLRPGDPRPSEQTVHQRLLLGCGGAARSETAGGLGVTFVSILPPLATTVVCRTRR